MCKVLINPNLTTSSIIAFQISDQIYLPPFSTIFQKTFHYINIHSANDPRWRWIHDSSTRCTSTVDIMWTRTSCTHRKSNAEQQNTNNKRRISSIETSKDHTTWQNEDTLPHPLYTWKPIHPLQTTTTPNMALLLW